MHRIVNRSSLLSVVAAALLMTGCASMDDVRHAQATADQALSTAQEAKQMAADAQNAAHAAQQSVEQSRIEQSTTHTGGERG